MDLQKMPLESLMRFFCGIIPGRFLDHGDDTTPVPAILVKAPLLSKGLDGEFEFLPLKMRFDGRKSLSIVAVPLEFSSSDPSFQDWDLRLWHKGLPQRQ